MDEVAEKDNNDNRGTSQDNVLPTSANSGRGDFRKVKATVLVVKLNFGMTVGLTRYLIMRSIE